MSMSSKTVKVMRYRVTVEVRCAEQLRTASGPWIELETQHQDPMRVARMVVETIDGHGLTRTEDTALAHRD